MVAVVSEDGQSKIRNTTYLQEARQSHLKALDKKLPILLLSCFEEAADKASSKFGLLGLLLPYITMYLICLRRLYLYRGA